MKSITYPVNEEFIDFILPYLKKLTKKIGDEFVVFGSGTLYLLGILDFHEKFHDLDIALKYASKIPPESEVVYFENNFDQPLYKIYIDDLMVDIGTVWQGQEEAFIKIFIDPIKIKGFKFANLQVDREYKKNMVNTYNREKDIEYLALIDKYLQKNRLNK